MITMKKLQEQIDELKNKETYEEEVNIIAEAVIYKEFPYSYKEKKKNLIKKGFKYKETKKTIFYPNEYEIWIKNLGTMKI